MIKVGAARSYRTKEPHLDAKHLLRTNEATVTSEDPDLKQYSNRIYTFKPTNLTVAAEAIRDYPLAHRLYVAALLVFIFKTAVEDEELKEHRAAELLRKTG